jgi:CheY-like chemotaxis protein/nitrogen-specific signal transduction histidine kinase
MDPEKILVADDDEDVLFMIVLALKKQGYEVAGAKDGLEALEKIRQQGPFSILMTDLMMPGMNGLALLRAARSLDPLIEIIIVTAAGTLDSAISAMREDGAYDFILKPFETIDQLVMAVERALAHRKLILDQKNLQVLLQQETDWLRALIANTVDVILAANKDGVLTVVNPSAQRLLKISNEMIGLEARTSLPPLLRTILDNWQSVGQNVPALLEVTWMDGSFWSINLTPVMGVDEGYLGWVMVMSNITHLKRLDNMRTQILSDAVQKIQLPMAQALNEITTLSALGNDDERISGLSYRMTNTWRRIEASLEQMAVQSQVGPSVEVRAETIPIEKVLDQAVAGFTKKHAYKAKLLTHFEPDLPKIYLDPNILNQALDNLLQRAVLRSQASDEYNGKNGAIQLEAFVRNKQLWIEIKDQGQPIDKDNLLRLFEQSFFEASMSQVQGIGLFEVKSLIDKLGGQVWVSGQEPLGGCIAICLPIPR